MLKLQSQIPRSKTIPNRKSFLPRVGSGFLARTVGVASLFLRYLVLLWSCPEKKVRVKTLEGASALANSLGGPTLKQEQTSHNHKLQSPSTQCSDGRRSNHGSGDSVSASDSGDPTDYVRRGRPLESKVESDLAHFPVTVAVLSLSAVLVNVSLRHGGISEHRPRQRRHRPCNLAHGNLAIFLPRRQRLQIAFPSRSSRPFI